MKYFSQPLILSLIAASTVALASAPSSDLSHTPALRNSTPIGSEFLGGERIYEWVYVCPTGHIVGWLYHDRDTCESQCANACEARWRP